MQPPCTWSQLAGDSPIDSQRSRRQSVGLGTKASEMPKYRFVLGLYVLRFPRSPYRPIAPSTSATTSAWSRTSSSYAAGGDRKPKMSCPRPAFASEAASAGRRV